MARGFLFIVLTLELIALYVPGGGAQEDLSHTVHLSGRPHILVSKVSKPSALLPPTGWKYSLGGRSKLTTTYSASVQMKCICSVARGTLAFIVVIELVRCEGTDRNINRMQIQI